MDAMTRLSQAKLNNTDVTAHILNRLLFLGASAAVALSAAAPYAAAAGAPALYPVCANGTVILMPFPGGEEKDEPARRKAACHAACLGERPRLQRLHAKARRSGSL